MCMSLPRRLAPRCSSCSGKFIIACLIPQPFGLAHTGESHLDSSGLSAALMEYYLILSSEFKHSLSSRILEAFYEQLFMTASFLPGPMWVGFGNQFPRALLLAPGKRKMKPKAPTRSLHAMRTWAHHLGPGTVW